MQKLIKHPDFRDKDLVDVNCDHLDDVLSSNEIKQNGAASLLPLEFHHPGDPTKHHEVRPRLCRAARTGEEETLPAEQPIEGEPITIPGSRPIVQGSLHGDQATPPNQCTASSSTRRQSSMRTFARIQNLPAEPGCDLPRAMAMIMWWTDATHVTQFGNSKVWPGYMMFGNQSNGSRPFRHSTQASARTGPVQLGR